MNCRENFGLARPTVGSPAQIFPYNSLLTAIQLFCVHDPAPNGNSAKKLPNIKVGLLQINMYLLLTNEFEIIDYYLDWKY